MRELWRAFEKWLIRQFREATRIVTPSSIPIPFGYDDPVIQSAEGYHPIAKSAEEYQTFLRRLGYEPIGTLAYAKKISL